MKALNLIFISALSIVSSLVLAENRPLLKCSTPDDSIGAVDVSLKSDGSGLITVTQADDSAPTEYFVISGLKDLRAGGSATLVAQEKEGITFGAASTKASLMRVLAGQKSAKFAANGTVYNLQCNLK